MVFIIYVIMLHLLIFTIQSDIDLNINNVKLKVLGHSGKIELSTNITNKTDNSTTIENLNIRFAKLSEKDKEFNEVGKSGPIKHTFNNFAQKDFKVSPLINTTFQGLEAYYVKFSADNIVNIDTIFECHIYLFSKKGEIKLGNNKTIEVNEGSLKFSVNISNWPFCSYPCKDSSCWIKGQINEIGSFLDFQIEITGKDNAKKSGDYYDLGNSKFILDDVVNIDNSSWYKIPNDIYEKVQNTDLFTFRFPTFQKNILYDPVVSMKISSDQGNNSVYIVIGVIAGVFVIGIGIFSYFKFCRKSNKESLI